MNIPDDLIITIHHSPSETTLTPVTDVLAVPAVATPIWDGAEPAASMPEPPFIWFGFGWHKDIAGHGYEDICQMAAQIATHVAANDPGWPSGEVHVRGLPVVDTSFDFIASPAEQPADHTEAQRIAGLAENIGSPELADALRSFAASRGRE